MHPDLNSAEEALRQHGIDWPAEISGGLVFELPSLNELFMLAQALAASCDAERRRKHRGDRRCETSHSGSARRSVQIP